LALSACRARVLKAPGVYSALAGGAALRQKTPASDFVTCPGRFLPGTARNVRRNLLASAEEPNSRMWRNVVMKE